MTNHQIVIVGGGPTGLMLAGELALAGVDVAIVERRETQDLEGSRAGGLHARSLEVLDQRGIVERFVAEGRVAQIVGFASTPLDISDFPSRHPHTLALWQRHIERILAAWVAELGVVTYRGREVVSLAQDDGGVDLSLADGGSMRAAYVVGCDGGRSVVRKSAGIEFPGWDPSISTLIAEVDLAEEPAFWGLRNDPSGIYSFGRLPEGHVRLLVTEAAVGASGEPTLADLSAALRAKYGSDYGVHNPRSIGRFTDMARQAAAYRAQRVLIAGDAAHVHDPVGGQGLNTGVQDAVNLGWKLALVARGAAPPSLLDTYHRERHPVAARVIKHNLAQVALRRVDDRIKALIEVMGDLLRMEEPRKRFGGMMSGLDIHYDLGPGHPLLGRRMPDLDLETAAGPVRTYALLHAARPLLLCFGAALDIAPWADRVRVVAARTAAAWELPVIGNVPAPDAVLVRPDGHVAWVGDGTDHGLRDALATWFGPAAT